MNPSQEGGIKDYKLIVNPLKVLLTEWWIKKMIKYTLIDKYTLLHRFPASFHANPPLPHLIAMTETSTKSNQRKINKTSLVPPARRRWGLQCSPQLSLPCFNPAVTLPLLLSFCSPVWWTAHLFLIGKGIDFAFESMLSLASISTCALEQDNSFGLFKVNNWLTFLRIKEART